MGLLSNGWISHRTEPNPNMEEISTLEDMTIEQGWEAHEAVEHMVEANEFRASIKELREKVFDIVKNQLSDETVELMYQGAAEYSTDVCTYMTTCIEYCEDKELNL